MPKPSPAPDCTSEYRYQVAGSVLDAGRPSGCIGLFPSARTQVCLAVITAGMRRPALRCLYNFIRHAVLHVFPWGPRAGLPSSRPQITQQFMTLSVPYSVTRCKISVTALRGPSSHRHSRVTGFQCKPTHSPIEPPTSAGVIKPLYFHHLAARGHPSRVLSQILQTCPNS